MHTQSKFWLSDSAGIRPKFAIQCQKEQSVVLTFSLHDVSDIEPFCRMCVNTVSAFDDLGSWGECSYYLYIVLVERLVFETYSDGRTAELLPCFVASLGCKESLEMYCTTVIVDIKKNPSAQFSANKNDVWRCLEPTEQRMSLIFGAAWLKQNTCAPAFYQKHR